MNGPKESDPSHALKCLLKGEIPHLSFEVGVCLFEKDHLERRGVLVKEVQVGEVELELE